MWLPIVSLSRSDNFVPFFKIYDQGQLVFSYLHLPLSSAMSHTLREAEREGERERTSDQYAHPMIENQISGLRPR